MSLSIDVRPPVTPTLAGGSTTSVIEGDRAEPLTLELKPTDETQGLLWEEEGSGEREVVLVEQQNATKVLLVRMRTAPEMTAAHEVANALSMLAPAVVCCMYLRHQLLTTGEADPLALLTTLGTLMHLPFSVLYHMACAAGYKSEVLKKLDFTFIHVTSVIYSYTTSAYLWYALINLIWNTAAVRTVWKHSGSRKAERSMQILVSVVLYTLPIAARGDWDTYGFTLAGFLAGGMIYQLHSIFGGWDHAVFHVVFGWFQLGVLIAASNRCAEAGGASALLVFKRPLDAFGVLRGLEDAVRMTVTSTPVLSA